MPWTEIDSYRVAIQHRPSGEVTRQLLLRTVRGYEGAGSSGIHLFFYETAPEEAGSAVNDLIVARLPASLFDDMYHLLQTERPLYFAWEEEEEGEGEGGARPLRFCALSTMEEPAGEGLADRS